MGTLIPLQAFTGHADTVSGSLDGWGRDASGDPLPGIVVDGTALDVDGGRENAGGQAGEFRFTFDGGGPSAAAFRIDIFTTTGLSQGNYQDIGWETSGIASLTQVTYILQNHDSTPGSRSLTPVSNGDVTDPDRELAADVQAAIWVFTDKFVFDAEYGVVDSSADPIVFEDTTQGRVRQTAEAIYDFVDSLTIDLPSQPNPSIGIDGPEESPIGGPAGPYTATVTGAASGTQVTFLPGVLDSEAATATTTTLTVGDDGTVKFWIPEGAVNTSTSVTATVSATVGLGTAFAVPDEVKQRIILASDRQAEASDDVTVTFAFDGPITVTKQDDSQRPLSGAEFKLVDDASSTVATGTTSSNGECDVTVDSPDAGTGTLTASWDTPYQYASPASSPSVSTTAGADDSVDDSIGTIATSTTKT